MFYKLSKFQYLINFPKCYNSLYNILRIFTELIQSSIILVLDVPERVNWKFSQILRAR